MLVLCPSLSYLKERLSILWLVSLTLKRNHFRAFISVLLLAFRACCLKCFHAPFSSSLFYPGDLLVLPGEAAVVERRSRGADA